LGLAVLLKVSFVKEFEFVFYKFIKVISFEGIIEARVGAINLNTNFST
jgi:hypothetical protein